VRVVFLGSGAFAIPSFEALLEAGHDVAALVTQPDKEKGRGRGMAAPPLKPVAEARGVRVVQPRRIREPEALQALRDLRPEVLVVVAYGQILPRPVLDVPRRGAVNVHGSLLPRYRGAAPIQWAIANGEPETGVTTMLLDEGMDTGPILLARATPIGEEETATDLEPRLARLGAALLVETLDGLRDGTLAARPQVHAEATMARILRKEDGRVDWARPAAEIAARARGFHPWPGATTRHGGGDLKLLRVRPEPGDPLPADVLPGTVLGVDRLGIVVAAGEGTRLRLLDVQPESRRAMEAAAFAAGARLQPGTRLG
jgi:methionyl-tRNA formyltransferase